MGMLRTALALGALAVSVPLLAQNGRYGVDRSRVEQRNGDGRDSKRGENKNDRHANVPHSENRTAARPDPRSYDRGTVRVDPRGGGREDRRGYGDRRDEARITVRAPVIIDRYDRHPAPRYEPRVMPPVYGGGRYRYGDHDFRSRDVFAISAWFRALPPTRLAAYGYYGPGYSGIRYAFRPGLYLSFAVYTQLAPLPYDLEIELGELPWYLERRLYGSTVLVIDTRTRMVVDIYDIDY